MIRHTFVTTTVSILGRSGGAVAAGTESRASRVDDGNRARKEAGKPEIEVVHDDAGVDLPVFGHVPYRTIGLYGGLAAAGVVGVLEWPVAAAVGITYALAKR
jgi:hypothetical protein